MKIISDIKRNEDGFFKIHKLSLQNKKNKTISREYILSKDAVAAVVYDTLKNKYIFVKQFRPGPKINIIEIPAGMIDHAYETPEDTMIREILEETGYETDTINQIVKPYYTSPGKTNEKLTIFFATVSRKISNGGGLEAENEEIDVIELSKDEIRKTDFVDGKTILALSILKLK